MRMATSWSGRVQAERRWSQQPYRLSIHSNPPRRTYRPHPTRNAVSSPCCFVIWWTQLHSRVSSTRKTCARWYAPTKRPAPRSSPALTGILPSISVTACSSTLATPWRTKMTPNGPYGLGILEAMGPLNERLGPERGVPLAVRLGIHTGLVVVGEVGSGTRQEQLALGDN